MIRERSIQSWTYAAGQTVAYDLPRDAVYHIIQIEGTGYCQNIQGVAGTAALFDDCFPFSILKNLRLLRNGSDVVFQGSGCLLAKEHYYLNETFPHARLYTVTASLETLLLSSGSAALGGKGITVPANDEGIGMTQVQFSTTTSATSTSTVNFDFQVDLYLQLGPSDIYFGSLVDARRLSSFQLELGYANVVDCVIPGTANTNTIVASGRVLSYDQDNLSTDMDFGTFKRSTLSISNLTYGSSNQQVLLPRGNYFHGMVIDCLAAKTASTTVYSHENAVITQLINRINSNFQLRNANWEDLQRKNQADGCANAAYSGSRGMPNGTAYLYYPVAGDRGSELVPTHVMDQWDLQLSLASATVLASAAAANYGIQNTAINGPENGATTASTNPVINFLLEEVIPGVSMGDSYPTAAMAGSKRRTSAKPYSK